jgi:hypothetical protein
MEDEGNQQSKANKCHWKNEYSKEKRKMSPVFHLDILH